MTLQKYCMLFIIVFAAFIAGYFVSLKQTQQQKLSATELAQGLNVKWFKMTIPSGKEKLFLSPFLKTGKDVKSFGGIRGFRSGEKIKVFIWGLENNEMKYSLIGIHSSCHGVIKPSIDLSGHTSLSAKNCGDEIIPGRILTKFSKKGVSISLGEEKQKLKPHETGLYFDFHNL